jgi:AAA domain
MNNDNQTTTTLEPAPEINPFADRAAAEAAKPRKASILDQVTVRKRRRPIFGLLYGQPGIGKSTFGASLPKPIVIATERLDQINVPKLPVPRDFKGLYDQIDALDKEQHEYESIVLDTVDAAELLIWQRVCSEGKVKSIEEFAGGWGKGYTRARELWTGLLSKLSDMSERYNVLLTAHAHVKTFADPSLSTPYDRWVMKIHDKSAEIIRQMVDLILFVQLETTIQKDTPKARKGRGIVSGDRVLWTQPATGYEAKNRYDLESPLEFSWEALSEGINKFYDR